MKRYYDLKYPFRFVCTSSAAAFLKKRSRESLAGRISAVQVYPFCLSEAVSLRGTEPRLIEAHTSLRETWAAFYRHLDVTRLHAGLQEVEKECCAFVIMFSPGETFPLCRSYGKLRETLARV